MVSFTLVTALFDLARREPEAERRTVEDYLEACGFVLGLDQDLIVFADPPLAAELERRREAAGLGARTRVIAVEVEDLEMYEHLSAIERARREQPIVNANPDKDTPLYTVVVWAKFEFLRRALELDPFGSTHMAWIDLGIRGRPHPDDRVFEAPLERVRLLCMRGYDDRDFADLPEYFSVIRGHVAATYMPGPTVAMAELADLFEARTFEALASGIAPNDEQMLPVLARERPDLFEFIHGDYGDVLLNQLRTRGSAANLLFQLRDARDRDHSAHGSVLTQQIVGSLRDGTFDSDPATLAQILDECFQVAWYEGGDDHELAREIGGRYLELVRAEPAAREVFLREEVRMRANLAFVGEGGPFG